MGFRARSGTIHLAQLLEDVVHYQRQNKRQLWMASFDVEKCYDTIPWWAIFGIMREAGIRKSVVECFENFYRRVRRKFRYGQVDGDVWEASNGLMQGGPESPDEPNLLEEPFHRWARAAWHGVMIAGEHVPSGSFADDVVLLGSSQQEFEELIGAYLE